MGIFQQLEQMGVDVQGFGGGNDPMIGGGNQRDKPATSGPTKLTPPPKPSKKPAQGASAPTPDVKPRGEARLAPESRKVAGTSVSIRQDAGITQRRPPKQRRSEPEGEGIKPLETELQGRSTQALQETLETLRGKRADSPVIKGSTLSIGETRELIRKELRSRR